MKRVVMSFLLILSILVSSTMNLTMRGEYPVKAYASERKEQNPLLGAVQYELVFQVESQWNGAFNGTIRIKNTGSSVIDNWILKLSLGHEITNIWNASILEHQNGEYIIKNAGWNQDIPINGEINFGFTAAHTGTILPPNSHDLIQTIRPIVHEDYSVQYSKSSDWSSGYVASLLIKNLSNQPIEDWILEFDFDGRIGGFWDAVILSNEGNHYIIKNKGYNQNIGAEATLSLGFYGAPGNLVVNPTNFKLYGYGVEQSKAEDEDKEQYEDKDEDGIDDQKEIELGFDPSLTDTDGDGFPDGYELYILYPQLLRSNYREEDGVNPQDDYDQDGLSNIEEFLSNTNPGLSDTDGDGLCDAEEIRQFGTDPCLTDTDHDGMRDGTEISAGLNPLIIDTDGNQIPDNMEVISQVVSNTSLQKLILSETGVKPVIEIVGTGDYSARLRVEDVSYNQIYQSMDFMVGHPFDFIHEEPFDFDSSTLSFVVGSEELQKHSIECLKIAYYDEINQKLEILDTQYDGEQSKISAKVSHYSVYFVVDINEYSQMIRSDISGSTIDGTKADIVILLNTDVGTIEVKENMICNLHQFLDDLEESNLDLQIKIIEYQETYSIDDGSIEVYDDWYRDNSTLHDQVDATLGKDFITNKYRRFYEALQYAEKMEFRNDASKHIINISDYIQLLGFKEKTLYYADGTEEITSLALMTDDGFKDVPVDEHNEEYVEEPIQGPLRTDIIYSQVIPEARYDYEMPIGEGIKANIYGDFAEDLSYLIDISSEKASFCSVRLTSGNVVTLKKDPTLCDETIDTDQDGIPDIIELGKVTQITVPVFTSGYNSLIDHKPLSAWSYRSNPAVADTDGDGLIDSEDPNPTTFDLYVKQLRGDSVVELSTGAFYNIFGLDINEFYERYYTRYLRIGQKAILENLKRRLDINENMMYSYKEAAYLFLIDIHGMKGYLHTKDIAYLQKVYKELTGSIADESTLGQYFSVISPKQAWNLFVYDGISQIILGKFSDKGNLFGTAGELGLAFTGVDFIQDLRDLEYDIIYWETNWEHVGETVLDGIGLIPVIGVISKGDELYAIGKHSDNLFDIRRLKGLDQIIQNLDGLRLMSKNAELTNTAKGMVESFGSYLYWKVLNTLEGTNGYQLAFAGAGSYDNILLKAIAKNADDLKYIQDISPSLSKKVLSDITTEAIGKNADEISKIADDAFDLARETADGIKGAGKFIWSKIKATQPVYNGTVLPRSFEITIGNKKLWVHGNGTKHMYDDIVKNIRANANNPGFDIEFYTQLMMEDFVGALEIATKDGVIFDQIMNVGKWELKFSPPREEGLLPVIIHAVFKGWGN